MSDGAHDRLSDLFLRVVDLDPVSRSEILDRECADDPALRSRVERFIENDRRDSALDVPIGSGVTEAIVQRPPPRQLGGYSIVSLLGRGGMATVYRARQENPARDVAIKVLDLSGPSRELARRFALEAQVLARLSHPGIATIYETGVEGDRAAVARAYIAMEFVEGVPLTRWAREQSLSAQDRASLLARVCDAVQHAHQRGVIHRDLKPANILVTPEGAPKVLDFGVARLTTDVTCTIPGMVVGTLAYMSPEQLEGSKEAIDTRTDIYALGVLLFELFMQRTPVDLSGLSLAEAMARSRSASTPASSPAAMPGAPAEIASIYAKATHPDAALRYASAAAMAEDLRRWIRHEPILARPASLRYSAIKWARRNPALLAVSIAAALATIGGLGAFAWQTRVARDATRVAQQETRAAEAVTTFIERTFGSLNGRSEGPNVRVADMLDRAAAINARDNIESPEVMARLASLFGRSYLSLGLLEKGIEQFTLAVDSFPVQDSEHALVARQFLANTLRRTPERQRGLAMAVAVLEDRRRISGPDATQTLFALRSVGLHQMTAGDYAGALRSIREAVAGYDRVVGPQDEDAMHTLADLASVHAARGEHAAALEILGPLHTRALATLKPNHPTTVNVAMRLAAMYSDTGEPARAETICRECLASAGTSLGPQHPLRRRLTMELGRALRLQGRVGEALEVLRPAADAVPPAEGDLAGGLDLLAELARSLREAGHPEAAAPIIEQIRSADRDEPRHAGSPAARRAMILGDAP